MPFFYPAIPFPDHLLSFCKGKTSRLLNQKLPWLKCHRAWSLPPIPAAAVTNTYFKANKMNSQDANNGSSSSGGGQSSSARNGHGRYNHEPRHYTPVYQRAANLPGRDGSGAMLTGTNQTYRPRYGSRGNAPGAINNLELVPNSYPSQYILVPNSGVIGGAQQVPPFMAGQNDQMSQCQYFPPGVYPGIASTMIPNGYPSWPYMVNYDVQDRQNAWGSVDGQRSPQTDSAGMYYPMNYVPSSLEGAGTTAYTFGPMFGALPMPRGVARGPACSSDDEDNKWLCGARHGGSYPTGASNSSCSASHVDKSF